jgi:hypothetical protein
MDKSLVVSNQPKLNQEDFNQLDMWLMPHSNPSYSGSRDQEDHLLKPAWANSLQDPISKIPNTKKGWWSDSRCRP